MKLKVNPLVVAAALGLVGPAALADDDDDSDRSLSGLWRRTDRADAPAPGYLGDSIQVLSLDGTVVLDDGSDSPQGTWALDTDGPARQELVVDGRRVVRRFEAHGDRLDVQVTVQCDHGKVEYRETYVREA